MAAEPEDRASLPDAGGVLLLDKPAGYTSHDATAVARRLFHTRQIGHTGTLDPMATGLLVLLVGRAVKASAYVSRIEKEYSAVLRLGLETDTEDTTGTVLSVADPSELPGDAAVLGVLPRFRGEIRQVPPMYSAVKVHGRKLCDLARAGLTAEREARTVRVLSLEAAPASLPSDYRLRVRCSGGTYIRALCADIGRALGCGGCLASLRRTAAGGFSVTDALTLDRLERMTDEERVARLLPTEALFEDLPEIRLPEPLARLCRNGCAVRQDRIGSALPVGARARVKDEDGRFLALGEIQEGEGGTALRTIRLFAL